MKHFSLRFAAVAGIVGTAWLLTALPGKGTAAAGRGAPATPPKVAVIDLGYIFQRYEKLEDLRAGVKEAAETAQEKAKGFIEQARGIEEQLKSGEFENGSPEFLEREEKIIRLSSRFETYKATAQKELKKKDAQVLLAVYNDILEALELFVRQNGYTLVLQINRELAEAPAFDKAKVGQMLGQPVFRNQGAEDITEAVLAYLSRKYTSDSADDAGSTAPPATGKARPAAHPAGPRGEASARHKKSSRK